jgi:hypothetical protein
MTRKFQKSIPDDESRKGRIGEHGISKSDDLFAEQTEGLKITPQWSGQAGAI